MPVLPQIILGSAILILCTLIHIAVSVWVIHRLRANEALVEAQTGLRAFVVVSLVVMVLLASHTAHLYIWAISLWLLGALPGYEEPIYFALVTYTTVGYGDVTLGPDFRILGGMASVNGILAFGLTTAFLVGLFPEIVGGLEDD